MIRAAFASMAMVHAAVAQTQTVPPPAIAAPATIAPSRFGSPFYPIGPIGSWQLDEGVSGTCAASRNYGSAERPVSVSIMPGADQKGLAIFVVTKVTSALPGGGGGNGALILAPGKSVASSYSSFELPVYDARYVTHYLQHVSALFLDRAAIDGLSAARTLTIQTETSTTIDAADMKAAIDATDSCQAKLYVSWGIDPKRFGYGKPRPVPLGGGPGAWIHGDDYPTGARRANLQGRTMTLLTIGEDGLVKACSVIISAGTADLDEASCRLVTERGSFTPAKDTQGKAVASWAILPVRWTLSAR